MALDRPGDAARGQLVAPWRLQLDLFDNSMASSAYGGDAGLPLMGIRQSRHRWNLVRRPQPWPAFRGPGLACGNPWQRLSGPLLLISLFTTWPFCGLGGA